VKHVVQATADGSGRGPSDDTEVDALVNAFLAASRVLMAVSARSIAAVEETVTLTQFRTLIVLERHGQLNLQKLADHLGVNASTAMRMIDRLIAAGLVNRTENPNSRREVVLTLTEQGTRLVSEVMSRRRAEISQIVMAMQPERQAELVAVLECFADAAGETRESRVSGGLTW
jgi:DNA-binding MarR family transcriptional regulator